MNYVQEQLKKTAPQYNSNSLNCKKNQEHRNIAPLSLQLRSYKKICYAVNCAKITQLISCYPFLSVHEHFASSKLTKTNKKGEKGTLKICAQN